MTVLPGDSHAPRLLAPGVGVLLGYVLLVGNPWINQNLDIALSDADSALRLVDVMIFYPRWEIDPERFGTFQFWSANLRTILFVGFAVAVLPRVSRWLRDSAGGLAVFVATVGATALSAVAAGMGAAAVVTSLLDEQTFVPTSSGRLTVEYFLGQLSASASFGVLFGLVLGAVVIAQRNSPPTVAGPAGRAARRRANTPKSFW